MTLNNSLNAGLQYVARHFNMVKIQSRPQTIGDPFKSGRWVKPPTES